MKCKLIAPVILAYVIMAEFITKFYFKKSLVRLCPLNTNSWFLGSRSPTLPTRSGTWKGPLGPCERGCGVRPLMVTDDVYGWLRRRTKWSKSREKGITRVLFKRKTTSFSGMLVVQHGLLFFSPTVSGDGPISLFPLQASICACAWSFFL